MIVCIISLRGYGFVRIRGRLVSAHRVFRQCIAENVVIICVYIYIYMQNPARPLNGKARSGDTNIMKMVDAGMEGHRNLTPWKSIFNFRCECVTSCYMLHRLPRDNTIWAKNECQTVLGFAQRWCGGLSNDGWKFNVSGCLENNAINYHDIFWTVWVTRLQRTYNHCGTKRKGFDGWAWLCIVFVK